MTIQPKVPWHHHPVEMLCVYLLIVSYYLFRVCTHSSSLSARTKWFLLAAACQHLAQCPARRNSAHTCGVNKPGVELQGCARGMFPR